MAGSSSQAITVAVRVRPPPGPPQPQPDDGGGGGSGIEDELKVLGTKIDVPGRSKSFEYDYVFPGVGPTQAGIYQSVGAPLVESAMEG